MLPIAVFMVIKVPKAVRGYSVEGGSVDLFEYEKETLLPPGTTVKISKIKPTKTYSIVECVLHSQKKPKPLTIDDVWSRLELYHSTV